MATTMGLLLMHFRILSIHARNFITIDLQVVERYPSAHRTIEHIICCVVFGLWNLLFLRNFSPFEICYEHLRTMDPLIRSIYATKIFDFEWAATGGISRSCVFFFLFGSVYILFFALIYLNLIRLLHLLFVSSVLLQIIKWYINSLWQLCIFHFPRVPIIMLSTLIQFIHFANPSSSKM